MGVDDHPAESARSRARKGKSAIVRSIEWAKVSAEDVEKAVDEYDRMGAEAFFDRFDFAPTTTYDLVRDGRTYPPKAILGAAYELATGERLASTDFEGGRSGAVKVLTRLGFRVEPRRPA